MEQPETQSAVGSTRLLAADSIEVKINRWEERLEELGWDRGPCDVWRHPKTDSKYGVMTAIGIAEQEAANEKAQRRPDKKKMKPAKNPAKNGKSAK